MRHIVRYDDENGVVTAALTPGSWECERYVIAQWLAGERQPSPSRGISRPGERSITISRPASRVLS
ncbi:hypothetical protein GCM10011579_096740 [Streptomyces albiflavescens]|uniref:Uncharacterized protein n=1 Tax=Streptomyces albiflavescens TaxID=1623582 RepID=A0A918DBF9_9ACTN|nr:hypothetical protein GCM10011579_096740 [Streptomyces albiflavescens]